MRQQSQEAYDVAVRSKSASDWAHFLQLRKAKNKQMKALKQVLFVKDASKAADLWAAENGSKAGRQQAACGIHAPGLQQAPVRRSWTAMARSGT
jgi:hypothetical protein